MNRFFIYALLMCLFLSRFGPAAEDAEATFQQGLEALRAENNVAAVKAFARAADLATSSGNESLAIEAGSALFWTRRRLNLQQVTLLNGDEKVAKKIDEVVSKKLDSADADKWLEQADKFAIAHSNDALRCAISYFHCGEKFSDTAPGRAAIKKSLDWLSKIKNEPAKVQVKGPVPAGPQQHGKGITITGNSGYAVDTLREGASVFSNQDGTSWAKPPADLDGKSFTKVPSGKPEGIKLRFDSGEKVTFLIDPSWAPTRQNVAVLKRLGAFQEKTTLTGGINKHQIWTIIGKPGQTLEFPVQIVVVADKILLEVTN
jgi:hypothetical protein